MDSDTKQHLHDSILGILNAIDFNDKAECLYLAKQIVHELTEDPELYIIYNKKNKD